MEHMNMLAVLCAALATLPLGFLWYGPLFGKAWMNHIGKTREQMEGGNMVVMLVVTLLCAFFVAFSLQFNVIHQFHVGSMMMNQPDVHIPGSAANTELMDLMTKYGNEFRTFKHGAFHGFLTGLFIVLPITAMTNMYERRSFKLTLIQAGYWIVGMMIMGGIICAWK